MGKVQLNYLSNKNSSLVISNTITDLYKIEDLCNYSIIDNMHKAIRIYPTNIKDAVERCSKENLINKLNNVLNKGIRNIVINDFDLDLDEIKNKIMPLADEFDAIIFVNTLIDKYFDDKIILVFNNNILDYSDEKWEEAKEQAIENINSNIQKSLQKKAVLKEVEYDNELAENQKKELYKLFNFDYDSFDEKEESYDRFMYDIIKESYTHKVGLDSLTVSLTVDNDILINDGNETVKIKNDQLNYLANTLKQLVNI